MCSYEGHAAGEDHENDERLEVLVLDQPVHDEAPAAPDLAGQRVSKRVHPRALADAVLGTAVIRVLPHKTSQRTSESNSIVVVCFTGNNKQTVFIPL